MNRLECLRHQLYTAIDENNTKRMLYISRLLDREILRVMEDECGTQCEEKPFYIWYCKSRLKDKAIV
ncbi:MAG: hypothetical protein N2645_03125 [Clostridia bacterium]|nr:hypothetical protein [Clostridia bacterium]